MSKQPEIEIEKRWLIPYAVHAQFLIEELKRKCVVYHYDIVQYYTPNGRVRRTTDQSTGEDTYEAINKVPYETANGLKGVIEVPLLGEPKALFEAVQNSNPQFESVILKERYVGELLGGVKIMIDFLRSHNRGFNSDHGNQGVRFVEIEIPEEQATEENFQSALDFIMPTNSKDISRFGNPILIDVTNNKQFSNKALSL